MILEERTAHAELAERAAARAAAHIRTSVGNHQETRSKTGSGSLASQVVTEVDFACQEIILAELKESLSIPAIGLLTEELEDDSSRLHSDHFWCIDPLDGTLPFIEGVPGYSVSIALVSRDGVSQLGVISNPYTGNTYRAVRGGGILLDGEVWKPQPRADCTLHWMMNRSMKTHPDFDQISKEMQQLATRFGYTELETFSTSGGVMHACRVLHDAPAVYFTLPKTGTGGGSIWDYAATACLFAEAGVAVTTAYGEPLHLNHPETTFMSHCGVIYASSLELRKAIQTLATQYLIE